MFLSIGSSTIDFIGSIEILTKIFEISKEKKLFKKIIGLKDINDINDK